MELLHISLTGLNIYIALALGTILVVAVKIKRSISHLTLLIKNISFRLKLYEIPFVAVIAFMIFVSAWRCFYYPPTARDLTSGAEVIAEFAVKEKTMINSVFSVNLETTNNQFKPPYLTTLQIIYKYAGFRFGQIWLSSIFLFFIIFLYHSLSVRLHKILTGALLIFFIAIPEMYAYTIMALFDYSNAVFLFLALYFLFEHFLAEQKPKHLYFSSLVMAISVYIRSETLVLAFFIGLYMIWFQYFKNKRGFINAALQSAIYILLPVLFYVLSITIYINRYLPQQYNVTSLVNNNLFDVTPFFTRLSEMNTKLIFVENNTYMYGYFFYLFIIFFLAELIFLRGFNTDAKKWLVATFIIFVGLAFLGYLLPLLDLNNSTKRGLFKIFPVMLFYFSCNQLLMKASDRLRVLERK
jgi:ABC-type proline/glycine betaine transport system permease subunit